MSASRPNPANDPRFLVQPTPEERGSFGAAFERLVGIMARLRGPGGCPWDREQDLRSLRPYLIEEAYEVLEAIEEGSSDAHREELGDLLLQVVFQAELRREAGTFDAADVTHGIADKLVRRHPHVFGELAADGVRQAFEHWEAMKAKEKNGRSVIDGVPKALPALLRAQRTTEKASRVGFDWPDASGPLAKLREELGELERAMEEGDRAGVEAEIGDLLFSVVNLSRFLEVGAEDALHGTIERFRRRFQHVERSVRERGQEVKETPLEELDRLWEEAKAQSS
ncbi:MAG: nucleoside triphosphate pyrophosphohydrolase [Deltaproteobacteria bacterium]|nr:nucleoside triphosphate pyrophosphohydrolase [Deltaproteobacteria bacterium]